MAPAGAPLVARAAATDFARAGGCRIGYLDFGEPKRPPAVLPAHSPPHRRPRNLE
jgi:hypothetical protein